MRRLSSGIVGIISALLLAGPAGFAAQQQGQQPQPQAQPPAQTQPPPASTDASQQPQAQDQTTTSSDDETVKGVKADLDGDILQFGCSEPFAAKYGGGGFDELRAPKSIFRIIIGTRQRPSLRDIALTTHRSQPHSCNCRC